jgi:hypothetical protein
MDDAVMEITMVTVIRINNMIATETIDTITIETIVPNIATMITIVTIIIMSNHEPCMFIIHDLWNEPLWFTTIITIIAPSASDTYTIVTMMCTTIVIAKCTSLLEEETGLYQQKFLSACTMLTATRLLQ